MSIVHTRSATLADVAAIAPLFDAYRQFYDQPADLGRAAGFIRDRLSRNESTLIVAEHAAHGLVGFCQLYPTFCSVEAAPIYTLYDLFVLPAARRCGAGKALLQAAERHAARHGAVRMDLSTARTNRSAQTLYEALGWERDDVFYNYSKRVEPRT
jgi:ribosomal protein S18 acetylase RimI-like enzyme